MRAWILLVILPSSSYNIFQPSISYFFSVVNYTSFIHLNNVLVKAECKNNRQYCLDFLTKGRYK